MDKKIIKIAMLSSLPLIMIATLVYYFKLQHTFYDGRTQYLAGTNQVLVTTDSRGQPWILDAYNEQGTTAGTLRTLDHQSWNDRFQFRWTHAIVFDHSGNLWTDGKQSGLSRFDGKNWTSFNTTNSGLPSNRIAAIQIDNLDRVWIDYSLGGRPGSFAPEPTFGATAFDGNSWQTFTTDNSGLISNEVTAIAFDKENRAWFGTPRGISIFDGKSWSLYSPDNSGLVAEAISAIAFDKEGRAWIGTLGVQSGINIFDGKEWVYHSLAEIGFRWPGASLFGPEIFIDPSERIWVQENGSIRIFDGSRWIGLVEEDGYNNNVASLASDLQGNIWIANGNGRGLVEFDSHYPFRLAWQTQPERTFLSSGGIWYVAFLLASLLMAILLDCLATVALALASGALVVVICAALLQDPHLVYFFPIMNAGVYATVGATMGAFAGIRRVARTGTSNRWRSAVIGFVVGLVIGTCQILPGLLSQ